MVLPRASAPVPLRARFTPDNLLDQLALAILAFSRRILLVAHFVPHGMDRFGLVVRLLPILRAVRRRGGFAFEGTLTSGGGERGAEFGFGGGARGGRGRVSVPRVSPADKQNEVLLQQRGSRRKRRQWAHGRGRAI